MSQKNRILTVVHQEVSTPGLLGRNLIARGYELDRFCPCTGDQLPRELSAYEAIIVFGGPQSATDDDDPGIKAELNWIEKTVLPQRVPMLGICLGAQQLARVLGAKVGPRGDNVVEIGYWPVRPTEKGGNFLQEETYFFQWHSETFEIPQDAVHLARNDQFNGQAFSYADHAFAIEFHPEITREMINRWCTSDRGKPKLKLEGAQSLDQQLASHAVHSSAARNWLDHFLDDYLFSQSIT